MDQPSWNASHIAGFEYFGGIPARRGLRPMPCIRDSFWAGRDFTSRADAECCIALGLHWATEGYVHHRLRGLDGVSPSAMFEAVE
ncbi:hypothetical protein EU244_028555 [Rhodococcus qingshengii]|uniref:hypothetical protein n=1 Tax=Rhodococcus qingshengii TaxID=334542 RepID=UPI0010A653FF|nr:hypothetical protein [Rhodococcus qingshengii]THJ66127.1 hypothetical protein EU244_28270 [Rhodococcus qingshengii]